MMLDEIDQQAGLARAWAEQGGFPISDIAQAIVAYQPTSITLIGRGTSDNATGYAKYLLEILGGYVVSSASPSTVTLYGARPRPSRSACIAVSQSGQSPDLVRMLQAMKAAGSLAIALTNDPASPLARQADHVIDLGAGPERAVAATKTFMCELLALLDLCEAVCGVQSPSRAAIATAVEHAVHDVQGLQAGPAVDVLRTGLERAGHLIVISRGVSTPIAYEGALKIMETTARPALRYSAADFEHGPIACVHPGTPVIVVDSSGPAQPALTPVITRLVDIGAEIVQVGSAPPHAGVRAHVRVDALDALVAPIAEIVPLQGLAHALSTSLGLDPDRPAGLSKITRTS